MLLGGGGIGLGTRAPTSLSPKYNPAAVNRRSVRSPRKSRRAPRQRAELRDSRRAYSLCRRTMHLEEGYQSVRRALRICGLAHIPLLCAGSKVQRTGIGALKRRQGRIGQIILPRDRKHLFDPTLHGFHVDTFHLYF